MAEPRLADRKLSTSAGVMSMWTLVVVIFCISDVSSTADTKEYCRTDATFGPLCYQQDELLVVTAARYGRMERSSKCVTNKEAFVNCSGDVTAYLSGKCSGRKSCDGVVTLTDMERLIGHCESSTDFYLHATYECVKAEMAACSSCESEGYARVRSPERGRLASFVTVDRDEANGCGTIRCPWLIEVRPGQVVNVTLVDFAGHRASAIVTPSSVGGGAAGGGRLSPSWGGEAQCPSPDRYAVVKERANPKDAVVCGGSGGGARRHVYTSISNKVEVRVEAVRSLVDRPFFIEYQAIGCADVKAPANTWMKRSDDTVEVGCPTTGAKWKQTCVDGQWAGDVMGTTCPGVPGVVIGSMGGGGAGGEKPEVGKSVGNESDKSFFSSIPNTILIAAVIAVASIIGVLVLTSGIVCIKKHQYTKRHRPARPSSIYTRATEEFEFRSDAPGQAAAGSETAPMMMMMTNMAPSQRGGQPPPTASKPRMPQQQQMAVGRRGYTQDGQLVEIFDTPDQRQQMVMIGNRPLPSIPPGGSGDRRPGRALQQAQQMFLPPQHQQQQLGGQPFQTTAMMHHPYQYPATAGYPHPHAECTCHGPPRGGPRGNVPGYQTQPPPQLAPKVRSVGTGPTVADGWGGYGSVGGGSLGRPYSEALYGNECGDLPAVYRSSGGEHTYFVLDADAVRDRPPPSPTPSQRMAAAAAAAAASTTSSMQSRGGTGGRHGGPGGSDQRFPTPPPPLPEAVVVVASPSTPLSTSVVVGQQLLQSTPVAAPQPAAAAGVDATVSARRQSPDGKERDENRDGGGGGGTMDELKNAGSRCSSVHEIPLRPTRDGPAAGLMSPNGVMKCVDENDPALVGTNVSSWP